MAKPKTAKAAPAAWSYIAHKNGYWAGLAAGEMRQSDLRKFLGEFAANGFTITPVHSREEFDAELAKLRPWRESPEWKAAHESAPPKEEPLPLFAEMPALSAKAEAA